MTSHVPLSPQITLQTPKLYAATIITKNRSKIRFAHSRAHHVVNQKRRKRTMLKQLDIVKVKNGTKRFISARMFLGIGKPE